MLLGLAAKNADAWNACTLQELRWAVCYPTLPCLACLHTSGAEVGGVLLQRQAARCSGPHRAACALAWSPAPAETLPRAAAQRAPAQAPAQTLPRGAVRRASDLHPPGAPTPARA